MNRPSRLILVIPFLLAACGSTTQDRAITGGGIGAAGGAIIGAITGLTVLEGALIGTGLGAAFGGFTSPDSFNLGKPIWEQFNRPTPTRTSAAPKIPSKEVVEVQKDLKRLGYDPGPIDGVLGPKTKAAIARFEREQGHSSGGINTLAGDTGKMATTSQKSSRK